MPIVLIASGGAAVAGELALHLYLSERAEEIKWSGADPKGRKRHCYVNCMSTRLHLGNTAIPTVFGTAKEVVNMTQNGDLDDSIGDMNANFYGQTQAIFFWRSCSELCDECQL